MRATTQQEQQYDIPEGLQIVVLGFMLGIAQASYHLSTTAPDALKAEMGEWSAPKGRLLCSRVSSVAHD